MLYVKKSLVTLLLLFFTTITCHAFNSAPAIVEKVINDVDVGIPYRIFQGTNALWLVSENGVFAVTGLATAHYSLQNTALENTDILDIF